ncbi:MULTISPECIES: hypothetical protein [unclassified Nonomuraea]|uniref:hypothetical protein n=1 Tax=unclassified Nonomuraea TaxID=2593643 RepID=UPI0033CD6090
MITLGNITREGDPQRRMRALATVLAALAVVAVTAAPTPAAAQQRVLTRACAPSSGTQTMASEDTYTKANVNLCVSVEQRDDGTKVIRADLSGDYFYYWGAAWYSDCPTYCYMKGAFKLRKDGREVAAEPFHRRWSGSNLTVTQTFEADSGHHEVHFEALKYGGYWRDERITTAYEGDHISMNIHVGVDVP